MKTSYYSAKHIDPAKHIPVRISVGHPRWKVPYGPLLPLLALAPEREMLSLGEADYEVRYRKILDTAGVSAIRARLIEIQESAPTKEIVLLCFESLNGSKPGEFCHRRQFAKWWEEKTGEIVSELRAPSPVPIDEKPKPKTEGQSTFWSGLFPDAVPSAPGRLRVASESERGYYEINLEPSCTCRGYRSHGHCKHLDGLGLGIQQMSLIAS